MEDEFRSQASLYATNLQEKLAQKKSMRNTATSKVARPDAERAVRAGDDELAKEVLRRRVEAEAASKLRNGPTPSSRVTFKKLSTI